ncbi:MAG TPA: hypothetical protein VN081_07060 [Dongiaceae bacterium]|nr:hypothetical protein [Dongiaceae bacterium]
MSGQQKCCAKIEAKTIWGRERSACTKNAKVERDGMHYCGFHDPVARKEKQKARDDATRKKVAEEMRVHRIRHAAPDLLEASQEAIRLIEWLEILGKDGTEIYKHELRSAAEQFRSQIEPAIRKATGEKE